MDEESLDIIAQVYEVIIKAGVYRVPSIKRATDLQFLLWV